MLDYFICFYFTVNPGQIAMWDSGFLIEVYSRQCQALARSVKMNEKSEREAKEARKQRKRE